MVSHGTNTYYIPKVLYFFLEDILLLSNLKIIFALKAAKASGFFESLSNNELHVSGPEEGAAGKGIKFTDPRVCKSFLRACCPHEILASTVRAFSCQFFLQKLS